MKYILFFTILFITLNAEASDYTFGCGPKVQSHTSDFLINATKEKNVQILGVNCQFIVSSDPQTGKWLPALPSIRLMALSNPFFNSFNKKTRNTELSIHFPVYRGRDYEAGLAYEYKQLFSPTELKEELALTSWPDNEPTDPKQALSQDHISVSSYLFFPENNIINELGLGINRVQQIGRVNNPNQSNDFLGIIDTYQWFFYIEHRAQSLGWDLPFRFALHQGEFWNNSSSKKQISLPIIGISAELGLSYSYRINYKWTLRASANQNISFNFGSQRKENYYYKDNLVAQRSFQLSVYHHF